jgi:catalase
LVFTFRLINAEGKATFVRFHWKPVAGKASLVWDEAQKLTGRDPDFHRRELWESIEAGDYPEYELGLQLIPEEDEFKFDFDLLDPTKLIPEELVPCNWSAKWCSIVTRTISLPRTNRRHSTQAYRSRTRFHP